MYCVVERESSQNQGQDVLRGILALPRTLPYAIQTFTASVQFLTLRFLIHSHNKEPQPLGPAIWLEWNELTEYSVSLASYVDPTKPRLQPERPTQVDLPNYQVITSNASSDSATTLPDFRHRYTQLKRPSDITGQLLYDFNLKITLPAPAADLVPQDHHGRPHLPHAQDDDSSPLAERTIENNSAYAERVSELKYDNDIIYRTVCRAKLPEGVSRIRLAGCRNFFSALEGMSEHWETDMDHYFIAGRDEDDFRNPPSKSDLASIDEIAQAPPPDASTPFTGFAGFTNGFKDGKSPYTFFNKSRERAEEMNISPTTISGILQQERAGFSLRDLRGPPIRSSSMDSIVSDSSSEADIPIPMYRGRRISSGIKMPGLYRTETVKGFLEAVVFNFNCKLTLPRSPATLLIAGVRVPIRHQTFLVHRVPSDRAIARQGIVEGPVMGSFVRQDVEAYSEGSAEQRKERLELDVLKELGCLLHMAQERRREGREERIWTKPRLQGGQWFSEMASDKSTPEDSVNEMGEAAEAERKRKKVKTKYETWKEMQQPRPVWDPKVKYMAVGREEESEWDEVSLFFSSSMKPLQCLVGSLVIAGLHAV